MEGIELIARTINIKNQLPLPSMLNMAHPSNLGSYRYAYEERVRRWREKAAEDSRSPGRWRAIDQSLRKSGEIHGVSNRAPASWTAAVLCRFPYCFRNARSAR